MLFQTTEFLVLMLIVLLGIHQLRKATAQHVMLVIASYVFYAWLDVRFLILLLISSCIDYSGALGIYGTKLTWLERLRLSFFTIFSAWFCLGFNWPLIQRSTAEWQKLGLNRAPEFTWSEFLQPGIDQFGLALGLCVAFALVWPIVYEWFFTFQENSRRNAFLIFSMTANLGMLAIFKYGEFILANWVELGNWLGYEWQKSKHEIPLPPGISFYTFVTMSYGIDAYRREIVPERSFLRMALFVSYFPHLVAGPVIRPHQLLPSLNKPWVLRSERIVSGFHLCLVGMFKKLVIADWISTTVYVILNDPSRAYIPSIMIWFGSALFAIQIYCDFSGYTDVARGVSRMLGVELPLNFDFPYFSTNIAEFWRRWHISLSTWLRDYLYIPLGGNRGTPVRVYFNLLTTMVLGGLWHGASWNFVIWGAYQGILLAIHRLWTGWKKSRPRLQQIMETRPAKVICWAITMYFVVLGWLIFYTTKLPLMHWGNSESTQVTLTDIIWRFVVPDFRTDITSIGFSAASPIIAVIMAAVFIVLHSISFFHRRWAETFNQLPRWQMVLIYFLLGFIFFFCTPTGKSAFIYFQF